MNIVGGAIYRVPTKISKKIIGKSINYNKLIEKL